MAPVRSQTINILIADEAEREGKAQDLGVGVSRVAEARTRQERWLADNQDALASSNAYVELHGLPLTRHRNF